MGIYPKTKYEWDHKRQVLLQHYDNFSGMKVTTVFVPIAKIEDRDNCFCCSCGEREGSDPFCRNHGFAGLRPCESHNQPGVADEEGRMPDSVQDARRRRDAQSD